MQSKNCLQAGSWQTGLVECVDKGAAWAWMCTIEAHGLTYGSENSRNAVPIVFWPSTDGTAAHPRATQGMQT